MTRISAIAGVPAWHGTSPAEAAAAAEKPRRPKYARIKPLFAPVAANWSERAACRTHGDPDLWFPVGVTLAAMDQANEAKQVCADQCPVRRLCLELAFEIGNPDGVWGGASEQDRVAARRSLSRAKTPLPLTPSNLAAETEWMLAGERNRRRRALAAGGELATPVPEVLSATSVPAPRRKKSAALTGAKP